MHRTDQIEQRISEFVAQCNGTAPLLMSKLYMGMTDAIETGRVPEDAPGKVIAEVGLGMPGAVLDDESKQFWHSHFDDLDDLCFRIKDSSGKPIYEGEKYYTTTPIPLEKAVGDERFVKGFERIDT